MNYLYKHVSANSAPLVIPPKVGKNFRLISIKGRNGFDFNTHANLQIVAETKYLNGGEEKNWELEVFNASNTNPTIINFHDFSLPIHEGLTFSVNNMGLPFEVYVIYDIEK